MRTASQDVLKAHVKGGVGMRGEDGALLADNVLGLAILVPCRVRDLWRRLSVSHCPYSMPSQSLARTCMLTCIPSSR